MKICGIYKITSPSGKIYIGQSIDIIKRWGRYNSLDCRKQTKIYHSLKKHGADNHKFEILCQCSREELNKLEPYYVELYQTFNSEFGLNLKTGGGVTMFSDETRKKLSVSKKGQKHTEEAKAKMRATLKGRLGKKHTEETKQKLSEALKGKKVSKETRQKLSAANLGKKHTEESKKHMSLIKMGVKNSSFGKARSIETKNKIGRANLGNKVWLGRKHSPESKLKISLANTKKT